jgi:endoglucanase
MRWGDWRLSMMLALSLPLAGCTRDAPATGAPRTAIPRTTTAVRLDHFGYRPGDPKVAIFTEDPGGPVQVRTADGQTEFVVPADGGSIARKGEDPCSGRPVWWVDFSPVEAPGTYQLVGAGLDGASYPFVIQPDVYRDVLRAALKTFYRQRCGIAKAAAHAGAWADAAACHRSDAATAASAGHAPHGVRDLAGGWHDAGDYNKYVWSAASDAVMFLLRAFEADPRVFPDGDLEIPESGNGVSDLLDEVKWELDFLLKMQLGDGSVLSRVHAGGAASGASPPSADPTRRYYENPTLESTAVLAGSCALGARVFAAAGDTAYAGLLRKAALSSWRWLERQGPSPEKVWAAAEIFRMDPAITSARPYVDGYHPAQWSTVRFDPSVTSFDLQAALTYVQAAGATPAVAAAMRAGIGRQVDELFSANDLYRNGMPEASYHWGSNAMRAGQGVLLLHAARLGATGRHPAEDCRRRALDMLHFFHGQNPLSMVYLTNMAAHGGEHSSWQIFHNWFGQSRSPDSRRRYVGKPRSVVEPHYPYFRGVDNHGIGDDKSSALGPAPGFVPGGPNRNYSGDAIPPGRAPCPNAFYRDWNDQAVWTARTWEITESSIGYQGAYVALAAAFATPDQPMSRLSPGSGVP